MMWEPGVTPLTWGHASDIYKHQTPQLGCRNRLHEDPSDSHDPQKFCCM